MRVVAGTAGGIRLSVPATEVRPTMDLVKAAIFSSLQDGIAGARVLDLFAGTGALGIEALSRGAESVLFVEESRAALRAIEENFARTKLRGRVSPRDVFAFLEAEGKRETFDFIFADPPYEKTKGGERFTEKLLAHERLPELLAEGGIFVLEKHPGEELPGMKFWNVLRAKKYGATEVLFLSALPR